MNKYTGTRECETGVDLPCWSSFSAVWVVFFCIFYATLKLFWWLWRDANILFLYTTVLLHSLYYSFLPKLVCAHAIIIVPILVIYSITGPENVSTTGVQVFNEPAVVADLTRCVCVYTFFWLNYSRRWKSSKSFKGIFSVRI